MKKFFGTDGIRGIPNKSLDCITAFQAGNALTALKDKKIKVAVGRDTRVSGEMLFAALSAGIMCGGGDVVNLGLIPTAGVAYITNATEVDYGIVISGSHNPPEYNGIKVFGDDGHKLNEDEEQEIEKLMGAINYAEPNNIGRLIHYFEPLQSYAEYLLGACSVDLKGLKVVLDCANGAASKIAPEIFTKLGATLIPNFCDTVGGDINNQCGCTHMDTVKRLVLENGADIGIAFDGDSDRVLVCDKNGYIVDGDMILYILAKYYIERDLLNPPIVVGTVLTNMGIENALKEHNIKLERTDVGDKYVIERMLKTKAVLGAEQSGHIIIGNKSTTGDGILASLMLCKIMKEKQTSLKNLCDVELYSQQNLNVAVPDKYSLMANKKLKQYIDELTKKLNGDGRILVRASGTEPKIRVTVESKNAELAEKFAREAAQKILFFAN